jgi:hypothetical protein
MRIDVTLDIQIGELVERERCLAAVFLSQYATVSDRLPKALVNHLRLLFAFDLLVSPLGEACPMKRSEMLERAPPRVLTPIPVAAAGIDRGDPDRVSDLHAAPPILIGADADAVSVTVCNGSGNRGQHLVD